MIRAAVLLQHDDLTKIMMTMALAKQHWLKASYFLTTLPKLSPNTLDLRGGQSDFLVLDRLSEALE